MSLPELIELNQADFITIDTIGPPGQRTFFLQAMQEDVLITLVIEKEHAAALAVAIGNALTRLGKGDLAREIDVDLDAETDVQIEGMDLIQPVEPLFRVGKLELGYDEERGLLAIVAQELAGEKEQGTVVYIWASQEQMAALARKAVAVVASGRPVCQLCGEPIDPEEGHTCIRDNGRKHLYRVDE
jgi:uncharacterized repeat protein (TIGR03847 family)